jgi:hypothetical protein
MHRHNRKKMAVQGRKPLRQLESTIKSRALTVDTAAGKKVKYRELHGFAHLKTVPGKKSPPQQRRNRSLDAAPFFPATSDTKA